MNSVYVLLVCVAGAATALQAPINARLRSAVHSPTLSALISFAVGTILLFLATILAERGTFTNLGKAPWWIWIGGALGALYVIATLVAVPRIGAAAVVASAVLGQLVAGIVVDSFGWFGVSRVPLSFGRAAGAALLAAGVFLLQRR
jgi:transporter family-2 protein